VNRALKTSNAVVVCVALLTLIYRLNAFAAESVGRVLAVEGTATIRSDAGVATRFASAGAALFPGDTVETGAVGRVKILLADETLLHINRNTLFTLKKVAPSAGWLELRGLVEVTRRAATSLYEVLSGEIWIRNKNKGARIEVKTPYVTAGVRGTEFNVTVTPDDEEVRIAVVEGGLLAFNAQGSVAANAGTEIVVRAGLAPTTRLLVATGEAVQWTLVVPALFTFRDYPLVSVDRKFLTAELSRLETTQDGTVQRAFVLRDLGELETAERVLRAHIETQPDAGLAFTALGWVLLDQGRITEAVYAFTQSEASDVRSVIGAVAAHIGLDDSASAARTLLEARDRGVSGLDATHAYLELLAGRPDAARQTLEDALSQTPTDALAWRLLALTNIVLGESQAAHDAIEKAIAVHPSAPSSLLIKSFAFQVQFDLPATEAAARDALALDPQYVPALLALARLQFAAGNLDAANDTLQASEQIAPHSAEVQNLKGFVLLAMREVDDATDTFRRASAAAPGSAEPHLGLALAHMRRGRVADGLEEITMAVALQPQRSMLVSYWGKMLHQIKRFDKALDVLDHAQQLDPRDPTPLFYKALILRDLNRPAEAIELLHQAIVLNDNRGVFRSRSLLDQDLAVRNVNLSGLYEDFGFNAWAQSKAIASVKDDYRNFEAHLFNAGILHEREDRTYPFSSEALLARLLQPANVNTFNSFNEYTSLFEIPSQDAKLEIALGTQETRAGEASVFGAVPDANLAYDVGAFYSDTEGWRETNFERSANLALITKWQPTLRDGLLLTASALRGESGDQAYPRFESDSPSDPNDERDDELARLEVGYHRNLSLDSDTLAYVSIVDATGTIDNQTTISPFDDPTFTVEEFQEIEFERPYYLGQLQYMRRFPAHQLIAGGLIYRGEFNADSTTETFVQLEGELTGPVVEASSSNQDIDFDSLYIQDIWTLSDSLTLEGALYAEQLDSANPFISTSWSIDEVNPRAGLIWNVTDSDTLRVAAFRYLLPFIAPRLDPTEIAGVWIYRNAEEGSLASEAAIVWEHEWHDGFWSLTTFAVDKEFTERIVEGDSTPLRTHDGSLAGLEIELNQLLTRTVGLTGLYRWAETDDELLPEADRMDQLFSLDLRHVRASGLSMGLSQTFRVIDFDNDRDREEIAITDADVIYELPAKRGELKLEIRNLFDEEFNWVTDNFVFTGRSPAREILFTYTGNF
jgi:tetratricopeptide (TPR) repeat protein